MYIPCAGFGPRLWLHVQSLGVGGDGGGASAIVKARRRQSAAKACQGYGQESTTCNPGPLFPAYFLRAKKGDFSLSPAMNVSLVCRQV